MRADAELEAMAATFRERNAAYGDNWRTLGNVMAALFPEGVLLKTADDFARFALFEWGIGKLTRFVNKGMTHKDSIHDAAVYFAMVSSLVEEDSNDNQG